MRPRRRTGPLPHVLVAGVVGDLPAIRAVLGSLPDGAYGQVYIESADQAPVSLPRPARVSVILLEPSASAPSGARAAAAVEAWCGEWLTDAGDPERELSVWLGNTVPAPVVDRAAVLERL